MCLKLRVNTGQSEISTKWVMKSGMKSKASHSLMRTHPALHVLCGVVWHDYSAQVTGGNMEPLKAPINFEFEHMRRELGVEIEAKVNDEIQKAR